MAKFDLVEKKIQMDKYEIIKFQLMTYCYVHEIAITDSDLECLTLLGMEDEFDQSEFFTLAIERGIFKTPQTVRNSLRKAKEYNLISKKGEWKKVVFLNPDLGIKSKGNILLNYKVLHIETGQVG
jgi:hypothetical protein